MLFSIQLEAATEVSSLPLIKRRLIARKSLPTLLTTCRPLDVKARTNCSLSSYELKAQLTQRINTWQTIHTLIMRDKSLIKCMTKPKDIVNYCLIGVR